MSDSLIHSVAGSIGSMMAMTALYPLERARTVLQTQKKLLASEKKQEQMDDSSTSDRETYSGTLDYIRHMVTKKGGWHNLYTGATPTVLGLGVSSGVYFFFHNALKRWFVSKYGAASLSPVKSLLLASAAGVINVFCTIPIWNIVPPVVLGKYQSVRDCSKAIYQDSGVRGFYKGLLPSLLLVSNPAIQFASYEKLKTLVRLSLRAAARIHSTEHRSGPRPSVQLNSLHFFVLGAIAKTVATLVTYPIQVIKTRAQSKARTHHHQHDGTHKKPLLRVFAAIRKIYQQEGLDGFYGGLSAKLMQTVLNSALMFLIYEHIVRILKNFLA